MRQLTLEQRYIVTAHADDEMNADDLTVYDLERIVLTGSIVERQKDETTFEYKYRVCGQTVDGLAAEIAAKLSVTGKLVFITIYLL